MPRRSLPSPEETRRILAQKRTRPQRRPPPPAGRSLAPLIKALDDRFGRGAGVLGARWREIVPGDLLADRTPSGKADQRAFGPGGNAGNPGRGPAAAP